jgi:hypothetical protein
MNSSNDIERASSPAQSQHSMHGIAAKYSFQRTQFSIVLHKSDGSDLPSPLSLIRKAMRVIQLHKTCQ